MQNSSEKIQDRNMSIFPIIICFYTIDTPYQQEVLNLINSCEKYQLENSIEGKPSRGS